MTTLVDTCSCGAPWSTLPAEHECGVADLRAAAQQMADDHQTSAQHHPNHVLVPLAAFDALCAALRKARCEAE